MRKVIVLAVLFFIVFASLAQKKEVKKKANKVNKKAAVESNNVPDGARLSFTVSEFVINVRHLDIMINSGSPELFPIISPDGSRLYFSRKSHADNKFGIKDVEDIWYATSVNGKWDYAKNMETHNTMGSDYICQIIPPHGKGGEMSMILGNNYNVGGKKKSHIFIAHSTGKETWSRPSRLRIAGSRGFSEKTDCFMTRDRKYLIVSWTQPQPFGYGEKDLYVAAAVANNSFGKLQNLGRDINTQGDDRSPFLLADERTLFFSSDGFRDTKGHQDVYVTYRNNFDSWTSWSAPINLGAKINGPMDELGFVVQEEKNRAFFCKGMNDFDTDIFMARVSFGGGPCTTIKGKFVNNVTKKPAVGRILLIQNSTGSAVLNTTTDAATGSYLACVPSNQKYHLVAINKKGIRSEPVAINLEKNNETVVVAPTVWFGADDEKPEADVSTGAGTGAVAGDQTELPMLNYKQAPPFELIQYEKDSVKAGILKLIALIDISTYAIMNKKAQVIINGFVNSREADEEQKAKERINEIISYFVKHGVTPEKIKNNLMPADSTKDELNTCKVLINE